MTQRLERSEQFKLKDVEMRFKVEGEETKETYDVVVYPKLELVSPRYQGNRWSDYTREMFIWGDDSKATYEALVKLPKESIVTLNIVSGKVKQNKQDNGQFESYFWNVTGIADGATPTPEPQAKPQPQPTAKDAPWDPRDTQARISWAQAINLAVAALGPKGAMVFSPSTMRTELATNTVERLANQFYPLILRGPGHQQPEAQNAEEAYQDIPDYSHDQPDAVPTPPVQPQGAVGAQAKPWHEQFFEAARAKGMKPTEALKLLGVGNWNKWVEQKHTLQEALELLPK